MLTNRALRIALLELNTPQQDIARLARIHESRLSQIVRGRVRATESERLRLSGVLQIPVRDLFPEEQTS